MDYMPDDEENARNAGNSMQIASDLVLFVSSLASAKDGDGLQEQG